ncbi:unnamed protein product [Pylaiella littoralis]
MRTPLMAAAASGNLALFTTVAHAVDASIKLQLRHVEQVLNSPDPNKQQLQLVDDSGMTVMMLAARSGNVGILEEVVRRERSAQDPGRLLDSDYSRKTVLMHAAGAGRSPVFNTVFDEICKTDTCEEKPIVQDQLLATSGDRRTILMHAARRGDQLGVLCARHACLKFLEPSETRHLITRADDEDMTFLMHAASGSSSSSSGCAMAVGHDYGNSTSYATATTTTAAAAAAAAADNVPSPVPHSRLRPRALHDEERGGGGDVSSSYDGEGDEKDGGFVELTGIGRWAGPTAAMDPCSVVFKLAWSLVKEVLWKEQIREELTKTDAWGRNILTHAVLSGSVAIFDAALYAATEYLLDDQVGALLGIDAEDDTQTVMERALENAPEAMVARVRRRDQELKKAVAFQAKMSTIEANVQSFIPGKLIVIFQMLLPVVGDSANARLTLLIVMTSLAPILSWAGSLVAREKLSSTEKRPSAMTLLLSAPAMFFWGLGTSTVGDTSSLGWKEPTTSTALAVATIVIPAVDAFFASRRVEQWYDKWSCQRLRFSRRALSKWKKQAGRDTSQKPDPCCGFCRKVKVSDSGSSEAATDNVPVD